MDNGKSGDNHGKATAVDVHVLTLTLTVSPWHLEVGGQVESWDLALAMLDQARRDIESKIRLAHALEAQRQMQLAAENAAIAERVRSTKM